METPVLTSNWRLGRLINAKSGLVSSYEVLIYKENNEYQIHNHFTSNCRFISLPDFGDGPEITNFDQIKKGDQVNVTYELAVAIELIKTKSDGIRSKVETNTVTDSKPNEKPSEVIANKTTIIADIVAVDRKKKLVSVKGPSGKITTVTVKNPALLADVNVGEQVKVIYYDAMAASITTPKK